MRRPKKDIPVSRTRLDDRAAGTARTCEVSGCGRPAEFPAPRNRDDLRNYYWFCLEHVQAYNKAWDYFAGMSPTEIERFRIDAITGHRPTWRLGDRGYQAFADGRISDVFEFFDAEAMAENGGERTNGRQLDDKQRKALAELDLSHTVTLQEVKMRYKQLVKRYHPDANGGDKAAEERFKSISEAYSYLMSSGLT